MIVSADSRPEVRSIECPVIDRFGDVVALDAFAGDEVGDRSGYFQDVGTDGEAEVREGLVEVSEPLRTPSSFLFIIEALPAARRLDLDEVDGVHGARDCAAGIGEGSMTSPKSLFSSITTTM